MRIRRFWQLGSIALLNLHPYNYAHNDTHCRGTYDRDACNRGVSMQTLYDLNAPKKPTNLSLNSDLLKKSKKLNVNLSATLEQALRAKLAENEAGNWAKENKRAITAYNAFVDENGLFADEHRSFRATGSGL
ncbi:MAG: antitoxin CcdA [Motiliproteus sp.]|jgi:antitoxin CcdA